MKINNAINNLLNYAVHSNLIDKRDVIYYGNTLIDMLKVPNFKYHSKEENIELMANLDAIIEYALAEKIIANDVQEINNFEAKVMGLLMPLPSKVNETFNTLYATSHVDATNYFRDISKASNYIRTRDIARNICWDAPTPYGDLAITINLSKPEKDPKQIAKVMETKTERYPECDLCIENEGFTGNASQSARNNLRTIDVKIDGEDWFIQHSPYAYYEEHVIAIDKKHQPMKIDKACFSKLVDFVDTFENYFIGSNADLPIVGGSILNHNHFQGGGASFPIEQAKTVFEFQLDQFADVKGLILKWPLSIIKLVSKNKQSIIDATDHVYQSWKNYENHDLLIHHSTNEVPHHTVTPICRKEGENYAMMIALRNNRTSSEFMTGIFHPHEGLHHIKKENIGLIEVMGLAILPGRLEHEIEKIKDVLINSTPIDRSIVHHKEWIEELERKEYNVSDIEGFLHQEIGDKFMDVLECCGVFKVKKENELEAFKEFCLSL